MKHSPLPIRLTALALLFAGAMTPVRSAELDAALQATIDARITDIKAWAAEPVIVAAVAAHNASLPTDQAAMSQDRWKALSVLDPFVRGFSKNDAAAALKAHKADWVTEAFLSDAKGFKVAFLSKPSNWCHAGKAKHDQPMAGKTWQGGVELDESTGLQQLQIAVPVLQDSQPIGSLVVGLSLGKL